MELKWCLSVMFVHFLPLLLLSIPHFHSLPCYFNSIPFLNMLDVEWNQPSIIYRSLAFGNQTYLSIPSLTALGLGWFPITTCWSLRSSIRILGHPSSIFGWKYCRSALNYIQPFNPSLPFNKLSRVDESRFQLGT